MVAALRFGVPVRLGAPVIALVLACLTASDGVAETYTVNSQADIPDASVSDQVCQTAPGNNVCTLRAAIQQANNRIGADVISLQPNAVYILSRPGADATALNGDLDILDSVTIVGAGPGSTIVDGNGNVTGERIFEITKCRGIFPPTNGAPCSPGFEVTVEISGVSVINGRATGAVGGGLRSEGTLRLEDCEFINNNGPFGGAISAFGPTTITRCSIHGNGTGSNGGGLAVQSTTLKIVNSTISGNFSKEGGGGLELVATATEVFNSTIAENYANSDDVGLGTGGGIRVAGGTTILSNSILAQNFHKNEGTFFDSSDDCDGTLASNGFNIVGFVDGCTVSGVLVANPLLGPLQQNGGGTQTHALLAGSPALDAGNPGGCTDQFGAPLTLDQRGEPRPFGSACDLGAFERGDGIFKDSFES